MFNIHASAGTVAMNTVMDRLSSAPKRPIVLSVTALTSFDNKSFSKVYNSSIEDKVKEFAIDSFKSGVDGVVTSVFESRNIDKSNF